MTRHWLAPDRLIDGTGGPVRHDVAVAIDGGRIVAIAPTRSLGRGDAVRQLPGSTLLPGMVDAHVHLLFTCDLDHTRTRRSFEAADDATLTTIGVRNATEALLGGVTTVRDCGDTRGVVATIRDAERDAWVAGPRILTAGAPLTTPGGHLNWCGNTAATDDQITAAVHRVADGGADLLKVMASGGNMTAESDPLGAQFTEDQLRLAVRTAHDLGLPVAAHAQNVASVTAAAGAGVDTIEHGLWRDDTGHPADPEELISLLAGRPTTVVLTFAGIQRALLPGPGYGPEAVAAARAVSPTGQLRSDFAWARALVEAGVPVAVASDAGVRFTRFRDFTDTLRCATDVLGRGPAEAVASVTGHAARAIGLGDELGSVAPGMVADLTVLQGGTADRFGRVAEVLRDGRTVVRDGALIPTEPPTAGPGVHTADPVVRCIRTRPTEPVHSKERRGSP